MTEHITFASKDGTKVNGELALPPGEGKAPGLVIIQEWWGLNAHIRDLVDRFAAAGFVALAPDLYHGSVTTDPAEAQALMQKLDGQQAMGDIYGTIHALLGLERVNGNVGITGFCLGGAYSFAAIANFPELGAAVPFYGIPPADHADYTKVRAPIQAHFASRDTWASPAAAEGIKQQIDAQGKTMELHVYEADHAFFNNTRHDVYNPEAAKLAWDRAITFLHRHLDG
jgi:carboxymethylenebutenolidase